MRVVLGADFIIFFCVGAFEGRDLFYVCVFEGRSSNSLNELCHIK